MNQALAEGFLVIGENLHATRALPRSSRRILAREDGGEAIRYHDAEGAARWLAVPDWCRETPAYGQGRIQHLLIALRQALDGSPAEQEQAAELIRYEVRRQIEAGARFLDLNVDEIAPELERQQAAMRWLVSVVEAASPLPLSIDSSNPQILAAGLEACARRAGRPLLNSAALDRLETLDLAREFDAAVIASASGRAGLPRDAAERVANLEAMIVEAERRGIAPSDLFADPLVLPIAVDPRHGVNFLESVRALRKKYGAAIHITGGLSNVSFGLPGRKLANQVFIALALEAGCDSAIFDPVLNPLAEIAALDRSGEPYRLTRAMLLGEDPHCAQYIRAWRQQRRSGAQQQPVEAAS